MRAWSEGAAARVRWSARLAGFFGAVAILVGWAWPDDLSALSGPALKIAWAAFMARTFEFHIGIGMVVLAVACLAGKARWSAAVMGVLGLAAMGPGVSWYWPRGTDAGAEPTLTVMSVNLLYGGADAARLAEEIGRAKPDVIVFQEYTFESAAKLSGILGPFYPFRFDHPRDDAFGQAVYSKLAFTSTPRAFPKAGRVAAWRDPQVRAEVEFAGTPVAIMDVHLVPPSTAAWLNQQRQDTLELASLAAKETGAFVLAGDFNATPRSRNLAALRRAGLKDAYAEAGSGRGTTWPRTMPLKLAPGVRIDHVLYSGALTCVQAGVCGDIGSDHRPTWARFVVAP